MKDKKDKKIADLETFRQVKIITPRVIRVTYWNDPVEWCVMCERETIWKRGNECKGCGISLHYNRELKNK